MSGHFIKGYDFRVGENLAVSNPGSSQLGNEEAKKTVAVPIFTGSSPVISRGIPQRCLLTNYNYYEGYGNNLSITSSSASSYIKRLQEIPLLFSLAAVSLTQNHHRVWMLDVNAAQEAAQKELSRRLAMEYLAYAVDKDYTLADNLKALDNEMRQLLNQLFEVNSRAHIAVITGARIEKIELDITGLLGESVKKRLWRYADGGGSGFTPGQLMNEAPAYFVPIEEDEIAKLRPLVYETLSLRRFNIDMESVEIVEKPAMFTVRIPGVSDRKRIRIAKELRQRLWENGCEIYKVFATSVAVNISKADKADGLRDLAGRIAKMYGLTIEEVLRKTLAIGDSQIDLPMLNVTAELGGLAIFVGMYIDGLSPKVFIYDIKGPAGTKEILKRHIESFFPRAGGKEVLAGNGSSSAGESANIPLEDGIETKEYVLIAEDDRNTREWYGHLLRKYNLMLASDGQEAWELFQEHWLNIKLVITDLDMPKMNGEILAHNIRRHPNALASKIKIMIISGRNFNPAAHGWNDEADYNLNKNELLEDIAQRSGRSFTGGVEGFPAWQETDSNIDKVNLLREILIQHFKLNPAEQGSSPLDDDANQRMYMAIKIITHGYGSRESFPIFGKLDIISAELIFISRCVNNKAIYSKLEQLVDKGIDPQARRLHRLTEVFFKDSYSSAKESHIHELIDVKEAYNKLFKDYWSVKEVFDSNEFSESLAAVNARFAEIISFLDWAVNFVKADARREDINLKELFDGMIKELSESHKPIASEISVDIDERIIISGDRQGLLLGIPRIISNMLHYKVRHIDISVYAQGENAVIAITDDGPGFRPENLAKDAFGKENIFQLGYTKRQGGTGLGLALLWEVINQHKGRVSAQNRNDGKSGARFIVEIPICSSALFGGLNRLKADIGRLGRNKERAGKRTGTFFVGSPLVVRGVGCYVRTGARTEEKGGWNNFMEALGFDTWSVSSAVAESYMNIFGPKAAVLFSDFRQVFCRGPP